MAEQGCAYAWKDRTGCTWASHSYGALSHKRIQTSVDIPFCTNILICMFLIKKIIIKEKIFKGRMSCKDEFRELKDKLVILDEFRG